MTARIGLLVLAAAALAGCDTTDPRMGIAIGHDMTAQSAAVQTADTPIEGVSAARGVAAQQRYLTGDVRQPVSRTTDTVAPPGNAGAPPAPQ